MPESGLRHTSLVRSAMRDSIRPVPASITLPASTYVRQMASRSPYTPSCSWSPAGLPVTTGPMPFHPALLDAARAAVRDVEGHDVELPSGALHDASEMAREVPTVMIFSSSIDGLSHTKEEDTPEAHLEMAADAFNRTCRKAIELIAAGELG